MDIYHIDIRLRRESALLVTLLVRLSFRSTFKSNVVKLHSVGLIADGSCFPSCQIENLILNARKNIMFYGTGEQVHSVHKSGERRL